MSQKKISSGVVHELLPGFRKSPYIRPSGVNNLGGYYTARAQTASGSVGLSQLRMLIPEATASSGAVPTSGMENDDPVAGPDAPIAELAPGTGSTTPEPATFALAGLVLSGLAIRRKLK